VLLLHGAFGLFVVLKTWEVIGVETLVVFVVLSLRVVVVVVEAAVQLVQLYP
jgi:hypothetical protein